MWQMEQGNRLKTEDDLKKVKLLCGSTNCQEYIQLKAVIDGTGTYWPNILPTKNASSLGIARRFHFFKD